MKIRPLGKYYYQFLLVFSFFIVGCGQFSKTDITSPGRVTNLKCTSAITSDNKSAFYLSWTNPDDADFAGVRICLRLWPIGLLTSEASSGNPGSQNIADVLSPLDYYFDTVGPRTIYVFIYEGIGYELFSYDKSGNFSEGVWIRSPN